MSKKKIKVYSENDKYVATYAGYVAYGNTHKQAVDKLKKHVEKEYHGYGS